MKCDEKLKRKLKSCVNQCWRSKGVGGEGSTNRDDFTVICVSILFRVCVTSFLGFRK